MKRRAFITLLGGAAAWPLAVRAQPAEKVARIGFLGATFASSWASRIEAFRSGLRDLGYVEGRNILIESRWAEEQYDQLPGRAGELVRLEVDVLLTYGTPGTLAAKRATTDIPIVFLYSGDAVAGGSSPASPDQVGTSPAPLISCRNSWRNASSCSRRPYRMSCGWLSW